MAERIRRTRLSRLALIPLLALVVGANVLSVGCTVGTAALPELPPVPVLLITARALPNAFQNSPYPSQFINTVGGALPLTSCTVLRVTTISGGGGMLVPFDPGSGIGMRVAGTGNQCEVFTTTPPGFVSPNVAPGTYQFTLRAADSSTPAVSDTENFTLIVEAGFSIITNDLEDGIANMNRPYAKRVSTNVGQVVGMSTQGVDPLVSCVAMNPVGPLPMGVTAGLPPGLAVSLDPTADPLNPGQTTPTSCRITGTPTTAGMFQFRVVATDSATPTANVRERTYTLVVRQDFTINPFTVVDGIQNRPYSKTFQITTNLSNNAVDVGQAGEFGNGPITTCAFSGLPAGITATSCAVDASGTSVTATLAGTPTGLGTSTSTVMLTDSNIPDGAGAGTPAPGNPVTPQRTVSLNFNFTIRAEYAINAFTVVDGVINRAYSKTFTVSTNLSTGSNDVGQAAEFGNGPVTACNLTGLPVGISFTCAADADGPDNVAGNADDGTTVVVMLTGTPTTLGTVTSTITLTDTNILQPPQAVPVVAGGMVSFNFNFTIRDDFTITAFTVVDGIRTRAYSKTFQITTNLSVGASDVGQAAEFGNGPITTCTFSGLPAGVTATSCTVDAGGTSVTATLAGTPTTMGTVASMVNLTDTDILQPPQAAPVVAARTVSFTFNFTIREEFSITEPNLVDGVIGRAYAKSIATNLSSTAGASDVGQAAEFGNGPVVSCTETTGALAGIGLAIAADPGNASNCLITGTPTSGAGTTINITIAVLDNDIFQPPQVAPVVGAATIGRGYTLSIRQEFSVTPFTVVDGIINRPYSKTFSVPTNLSNNASDVNQPGEFGNGPITTCVFSGLPAGLTSSVCTVDASGTSATVTLSGTPTATGTTSTSVDITDSDILQNAVVVTAANTISFNFNFTIRDEFTITEPDLVDAIFGRAYVKNIATTLVATDPGTDVGQVAELGNGPIATCAETTGALAGVGLSIGVDPTNGSRCRISGTPTAGAGTTINITVAVTDQNIFQPPQVPPVVAGNTISQNYALTIRAEFAITEPSVVDAVNGRAYIKHINTSLSAAAGATDVGQAAEAGNGPPVTCAATVDTVPPTVPVALPTGGFTIATDTNGCLISTPTTVSLATGSYTLVIQVVDNDIPQNAVVVVGAATVSQSYAFTVRANSAFVTTTVVDGITQRNYTKALVTDKTTSGTSTGAGNVTNCALSGTPPSSLNAAVAANNLDCVISATGLSDAPGPYNFTVTATDSDITQFNSSTGTTDIVVAGGTFSQAYTLVIRDEFSFVTASVVDAVEGRNYVKVVETNLSNSATEVGQTGEFGNGPVTTCVLDGTTPSDALPTGLSPATDATLVHCQIGGTVGGGQAGTTFGTTSGIILAATDSPVMQVNLRTGLNETVVPANTILSTGYQLYVRFPLAFELVTSNCPGTATGICPVAVKGRTYNVANGIVRQIDANTVVTGGDAPLTFTTAAGDPFTCTGATCTGNTACEGITIDRANGSLAGTPTGATAGICSFTVTLDDAGVMQPSVNFGVLQVVPVTPPGSAVQAFSIEVQPEMTIVNMSLPGGLKDSPYNVNLAVVNGLSTTTGPVNLPAIVEWSIVDGAFFTGGTGVAGTPCEGLGITDLDGTSANQGATISGTPVMAGDCPFTIQVTDNGNEPGTATFVPNGLITMNFTIVIGDAIGFVSNNTAGNVRVIRTDTDAAVPGAVGIVTLPPGAMPTGITVNPVDPLFGYVANGAPNGNVSVFCTRVEGAICPVAFMPPTVGPATVSFFGISLNPTDVAVASTGTFGVIADPALGGGGLCGGVGGIFLFFADRNAPATFNVPTGGGACIPGARAVAFRPQGDVVYVATGSDAVFRVGVSGGIVTPISPVFIPVAGATSYDVAVSPDGRFLYVTDTTNQLVHVFDADLATPPGSAFLASTPAAGAAGGLLGGAVPRGIAFAPDGRFVYVTDGSINSVVAAIDPATLNIPGASVMVTNNSIGLAGGIFPEGIAVTENSLKAFVANSGNDSVTSIDTDATPSASFQMPLTNFNGAGNFSVPFNVAVMSDPHLHIQNPLPPGFENAAYDFSVVATGGTRPYKFFNDTPLPAGLAMDSGGRITGMPPMGSAGTTVVTFRVVDSSTPQQTDIRMIPITIIDPGNILPPSPITDAIDGRTYTNRLSAALLPFIFTNPGGGPGSLNTADLDCSGLSLTPTGTIVGTATRAVDGQCTFMVDVIGGGGMSVIGGPATLTLFIRQEFSLTEPFVVDGVVGRAYSKHIDTNLLAAAGASDNGQGAEFGNGPATACTGTVNGNALPFAGFSITAETNGCRLTGTAAHTLAAGTHTVIINVTDTPIVLSGNEVVPANTPGALYMLTIRSECMITSAAPMAPATTAVNGAPFNLMFTATTSLSNNPDADESFAFPPSPAMAEFGNGPITSCVLMGALPTGLAGMTAITGGGLTCDVTITGTPMIASVPQSFLLTLIINDSTILQDAQIVVGVGTAMQVFTIDINQTATTTTIVSDLPDPSLTGLAVTVNFTVAPVVGGGTPTGNVTVTDGTADMCTGTVAAGTCMITLNTLGNRTLVATYAGDAAFTGSVSAGEPHMVVALLLNDFVLDTATQSRAITNQTIPFTGGTGPFTCTVTVLDAMATDVTATFGLAAAWDTVTSCVLSGTPTMTGTFTVTVTVMDAMAVSSSQSDDLTVNSPLAFVTTSPLPMAVQNATYTVSFDTSGGQPPRSISEVSGLTVTPDAECAGLTLTASAGTGMGTVSGTPTATGTCTFVLRVTDTANSTSLSGTFDMTYDLTVDPALTIATTTVPNALRGSLYNDSAAGFTLAAIGGGVGTRTWAVTAGDLGVDTPGTATCPGLQIGSATGAITGTATNTSVQTCAVTVQVMDSGNANVGAATDTQALTFFVLDTFLYVADPANNQVNVINTTGDTEVTSASIPIAVGGDAHTIAIRKDGLRAYVTVEDTNRLMTIDTTTNTVIDMLDLGTDPDGGGPIQVCTTPRGVAVGMAGNADNRAYVVCASTGSDNLDRVEILDISGSTPVRLATLDFPGIQVEGMGEEPVGIAVSPDGSVVFIAVFSEDELFQITTSATATSEAITFTDAFFPGTGAEQVVFSNDGSLAYFTSEASDDVFVVNAATPGAAPSATLSLDAATNPRRLGVDPDTGRTFITLNGSGALVTIASGASVLERSAAITDADRAADVVTITTGTAHGFQMGDVISITGVNDASINGIFTIDVAVTATTFMFNDVGPDVTNATGGTAVALATVGTAADGVALPPTNAKAYIGISGNVARNDDTSPFASVGNIALTGTAPTPRGLAHIPIPK